MDGLINVLPDAIANQIAAGEVVQRPASVVKELIENAVDAGSSKIKLIIKDAGKTLIQVIDNGCGMNALDARLCFERHATSKIKEVQDIFNIHTKGFRGEALASIAAVAHVELRTKQRNSELGHHLVIKGSEIEKNEPEACPEGSNFIVKNLFYNTPARRNFLKSDGVETKHIIEEFQRVALAHPDVRFELINNNQEVFILPSSNRKKRVVDVMGKKMEKSLIGIDIETSVARITGFIGHPQSAIKARGDQFLFVNDRFIKSPFFHHAISKGYGELLTPGTHPKYFLFFEIEPQTLDINIHPTKTEIKFQYEKEIYSILLSAVKEALGKNNLIPSIDFENPEPVHLGMGIRPEDVKQPAITINPSYNPFQSKPCNYNPNKGNYGQQLAAKNQDWQALQRIQQEFEGNAEPSSTGQSDAPEVESMEISPVVFNAIQACQGYLVTSIKNGLMIIDQNKAHQRILYEQNLKAFTDHSVRIQKLMFPESVEIDAKYHDLLSQNLEAIHALGLELDRFGQNEFVINGRPAGIENLDTSALIQDIIEQLSTSENLKPEVIQDKLAQIFARNTALRKGKSLNSAEVQNLIDELFSCSNPNFSPSGKPTFITFTSDDLKKQFQ